MLAVFDPVGIGVIKSLERPGANVTGTTMYAPQLIGERLEILRRIVPKLDKVAMVFNGNNANNGNQNNQGSSAPRGGQSAPSGGQSAPAGGTGAPAGGQGAPAGGGGSR